MKDLPFSLTNKKILITGGTGSFGRAFVKTLLTQYAPQKVIIFSRDEWKQWDMRRSDPLFSHPCMRYFLGDVRDKDRLLRAFENIDFVVHAAALKQVPAAEYDPSEFIKTNVIGAMNIVDAAINCGVERVLALSTDKAVNPINLYGATKLCSDKLFVAGNSYVGARKFPIFSVVRYGNVLGSRGSIIPLWQQMIQEKAAALPITDVRMTRFWITLEQAVELVMQCFSNMHGGEIFVPKIPSMHITDLAEAIAPNYPTKICGIRAGEKLHELMIGEENGRHSFEFPNYYVIAPESFASEPMSNNKMFIGRGGKPVKENFIYASHTNTEWIGVEELRQILSNTPYQHEPSLV